MRSRLLMPVFLVCALIVGPTDSHAQTVSRPDTAAILLDAARSFEVEGRWEVAEALYHFIGERFGETPAGVEARAALQNPDLSSVARNSRTELMVWGTTYGLWLGVALPGAFHANDPTPIGLGLLLGGPSGFLGARALSRSRSLSEGQVRAITFGSLWGTWQGWGWLEVLDWGREEYCYLDYCSLEDRDSADILKGMVAGGLLGVATGAVLARKPIASGVATTVNFGALWGTWFGLAGGLIGDADGDTALTSALLGGNAGLLITALKAPDWNFSRSRARLISISGVIGLLGGVGLDIIFQVEDERLATLLPTVTSAVGLAVGLEATENRDRLTPRPGGLGSSLDTAGAFDGSLLSLQGGKLHLGTPTPFPTLLPVDGPRSFSYRPGLAFNLFSSRF